jgi:molybdopterin synthase sulfur carrier subunit
MRWAPPASPPPGSTYNEAPQRRPCLPLVREAVRSPPRRRRAASILPAGLRPDLRCGRPPTGGRSNRHWAVGCTQERPHRNACVGANRRLIPARGRGGSAVPRACSAPRGQPLRSPARSRTANGKGHRDAAALSRPRTYRNPLAQSSSPVGDHLAVLECRASIPRARLPAGSPGGLTGLKVEANNFRRMVLEFECRYPGLGRQIEESMLVAIDGEIFQDAYFAPLKPDSEIYLIPKIGGG